jgi:predicted Zn-dependent protease
VYFYQGRYEDAAVHARKSTEIQPANPMNWGNLGDALWQIPARKEAAREAFEQAALLASQQLSINPSNVALRRTYALYLARLGRAREAAVQIGMAIAQAPNDGDVQFYAARVFMGIGETKRALAALDRCKALGYSRDEIAREPDLAAVSNSARNGAALGKRNGK